jgi:hypothetical protein
MSNMDSNVVKFPFSRARGAWSRMPRRSKNGTPEERAAAEVAAAPAATMTETPRQQGNPMRAKVTLVSRAATIAGIVNYQTRDLSGIGPIGEGHLQELRSAAEEARYLASELERAAEQLVQAQPKEPTVNVMTTEEFKEAYLQAPPEIQQFISDKMRDGIEKQSAELET